MELAMHDYGKPGLCILGASAGALLIYAFGIFRQQGEYPERLLVTGRQFNGVYSCDSYGFQKAGF